MRYIVALCQENVGDKKGALKSVRESIRIYSEVNV